MRSTMQLSNRSMMLLGLCVLVGSLSHNWGRGEQCLYGSLIESQSHH